MMGDEDATWDTFLKFAETMHKNKIASLWIRHKIR